MRAGGGDVERIYTDYLASREASEEISIVTSTWDPRSFHSKTSMPYPRIYDNKNTLGIKALLTSTMIRAKRQGCWFGLSKMERSLYSLALRVKVKFVSISLLRALVSVLRKLREMSDEVYTRLAEGVKLAWGFSAAAVGWGNKEAKAWRSDLKYAKYLGTLFSGGRLR